MSDNTAVTAAAGMTDAALAQEAEGCAELLDGEEYPTASAVLRELARRLTDGRGEERLRKALNSLMDATTDFCRKQGIGMGGDLDKAYREALTAMHETRRPAALAPSPEAPAAAGGAGREPVDAILTEFASARLHGQQKYGGGDPATHDLGHRPGDWLRFIRDHLERARCEDGVMTMEAREHLVKAGGLCLSAVWCADMQADRLTPAPPPTPGTAEAPKESPAPATGGADPLRKLYAERDVEGDDELRPRYMRHLDAMTKEGLHSKSAIAAELAYRDMLIARHNRAALATPPATALRKTHWPGPACPLCGQKMVLHPSGEKWVCRPITYDCTGSAPVDRPPPATAAADRDAVRKAIDGALREFGTDSLENQGLHSWRCEHLGKCEHYTVMLDAVVGAAIRALKSRPGAADAGKGGEGTGEGWVQRPANNLRHPKGCACGKLLLGSRESMVYEGAFHSISKCQVPPAPPTPAPAAQQEKTNEHRE